MSQRWMGLGAVVAMTAFALAVFPGLPESIPIHWNASGEVDRWSPRFPGAFLSPLLALGLWGLAQVLPRIDPRRDRFDTYRDTYWLLINLSLLFLAGLHVVTLGAALGWPVDPVGIATAGVGLLFVGIGNYLPRVRSNWWMGIRTPWTLSSEAVWERTHRFGGRLWVAGGIVIVAAAFLPGEMPAWVTVATVVVVTIGSTAYSYLLWRREREEGSRGGGVGRLGNPNGGVR